MDSEEPPIEKTMKAMKIDHDSDIKNLIKAMSYDEKGKSIKFCHTEDDFNSQHDQLDKILLEIGSSIKNVSFIHCQMLEPKTIFRILSRLGNVKYIHIIDNTLKTFDVQSLPQVELKHLENLFIETRTDLETLDVLKIAPVILAKTEVLESLHMNFHVELLGDDSDPYKGVREAISRQRNMIDLSICDGNFFNGPFENPQLELKTLSMLSENGVPFKVTNEVQYTHMGEFLKSQKNCETVYFGSNVAVIREPLKKVYIELFTSKTFNISISLNVQGAKEMMKQLVDDGFSNPNVIIFDCNMFGNNLKDHQKIIEASVKIFPKVRYLEFANLSDGDYSMSSILEPINHLKKLKTLVTSSYSCLEIAGVYVPTLKNLEMHSADCELHHLETFISNNPKVQKISIHFDSDKYDDHELHHISDFVVYALTHLKIVSMRFSIKTSVEDIKNLIEVEKIQNSIDNHAQYKFKMIEFYNHEGKLYLRLVKNSESENVEPKCSIQ